MSKEKSSQAEAENFALFVGGPLFRLLVKLKLTNNALGLLKWRTIFIIFITWVPLLIISTVEGHLQSSVSVPFLNDIAVHVRFLVALPLLVFGEMFVHKRLKLFRAKIVSRLIYQDE